ncbi:ABC transporter substrate-binding protein [Streptosporangium sp. CA-135522]|uniref:ABC transporter substrate-binding protein n=1 Tax=Streptosporangium sp. CA-135522 TaxID=3240072 RepID=UPI003D939A43
MTKIQRNAIGFLACSAMLALTTACAASATPATPTTASASKDPSTVVIDYVPGVSQLPYFDTAYRGAAAQAKKYGYQVKYIAVSAYDATTQNNVLNAELASQPDLLLVSPVDDISLRPAIQRYISAGIPVITVGGTLKNTEGLVAQIATDNYQGGRIVAESFGKQLNGTGTVAVLNIAPGSSTIEDRVKGFNDTMKKNFPGIKVLEEQYGGATVPSNQQAVRGLLLAHPETNAIFGATEVNGEGATAAVAAVGKTGQIRVAAFDASPEQVKQLKGGRIDFLSVSQPANQMALAIDYAHAHLSGDKASIKPSTLIPNVGVTKENIDDPAVTPLLYTSGS